MRIHVVLLMDNLEAFKLNFLAHEENDSYGNRLLHVFEKLSRNIFISSFCIRRSGQ